MKSLSMLLLAIVGIFCLSSIGLAEGFTVSADYNLMTVYSDGSQGFSALAFGGEDDAGPFLIGGSYLFALSYDPAPPSGLKLSDDFIYLYGGYKLLDEEDANLAVVSGYYLWKKNQAGFDWDFDGNRDAIESIWSSIVIGARAGVDLESILASALLLYGVSNDVKEYLNGAETNSTKNVSLLYLELKGIYRFTDTLGVFALYRTTNYSVEGANSSISGFGLGVDYRF